MPYIVLALCLFFGQALLWAPKKPTDDEPPLTTEQTAAKPLAAAADPTARPAEKASHKPPQPIEQPVAPESDDEMAASSASSETPEEHRLRLLQKITRFAKPTNDVAFKHLMRQEQGIPAHAVSFLKAMTGLDIKRIETISEAVPQLNERLLISGECRYQSFMDFACRTESNGLVIVEVQVRREDYFDSRALCYAAGTFASQLKKHDKWSDLKQVVALQILGHKTKKPFPKGEFEVRYEMRPNLPNFEPINPGISMIQIELPRVKLRDWPAEREPLKRAWLEFFKIAHKQRAIPQGVPSIIESAYQRLETNTWGLPSLREYGETDALDLTKYTTVLSESFQDGFQGGKLQTLFNLLQNKSITLEMLPNITTEEERSMLEQLLKGETLEAVLKPGPTA